MQDASASQRGTALLQRAKELRPMLAAASAEIDAQGRLTPQVVQAMHDAGLYKLRVPAEFGGNAPISAREELDIIVEIGRGNSSAAWTISAGRTGQYLDRYFSREVAEEVYNPSSPGPAMAISAFNDSNSTGFARKVDGGLEVWGTWGFATNIRIARWLMAVVDFEVDGRPTKQIVMIPRSRVKVADDWNVEAMRGTGSNTAFIDEPVFVPERYIVERDVKFEQEMGVALRPMLTFHAGIVLGAAKQTLELFLEKVPRRAPWRMPYATVGEMATTRVLVAEATAAIAAAESLLKRNVGIFDELGDGPAEPERIAELQYQAVWAALLLRDTVARLRRTIGSSTAAGVDQIGRFARDTEVLCLHGSFRNDWSAERYATLVLERIAAAQGDAAARPAHRELKELIEA